MLCGLVRIVACAALVLASAVLFMAATRQLTELVDEATATLLPSSRQHHGQQEGADDDASIRSIVALWWHDVETWMRRPQWWPNRNSDRAAASGRATSENSLAALTALWSHDSSANARPRDNDACSRLYVDSKNNQVCVIAS